MGLLYVGEYQGFTPGRIISGVYSRKDKMRAYSFFCFQVSLSPVCIRHRVLLMSYYLLNP